jgi:hypothetical protein
MVGLCHGANSRTSLGCSPKVAMVRSDRSDEFDGLIITGKHLFPGGGDRFGRIGFADCAKPYFRLVAHQQRGA